MRFFDFTNGKQFPETLHVIKNVPYDLGYRPRLPLGGRLHDFWVHDLHRALRKINPSLRISSLFCDYIDYVIERVPIYFVNTNQIGQTIEVRETTSHVTVVPDNHLIKPLISKEEMGRGYNSWEECFRPYIERKDEDDDERRRPEYPFDQEIFPHWDEMDDTMVEVEADALYCPTGGDPECQESNPEIFVYMDYFVDSSGNPTRPPKYLRYVIAHELAHAMMDETLWEAFLGQKLSKGIPRNSKRYYLFEEGLATAIGWRIVGYDSAVAQEIVKAGLPYSFGLSTYYHEGTDVHTLLPSPLSIRISEWLTAKINDPTPYL